MGIAPLPSLLQPISWEQIVLCSVVYLVASFRSPWYQNSRLNLRYSVKLSPWDNKRSPFEDCIVFLNYTFLYGTIRLSYLFKGACVFPPILFLLQAKALASSNSFSIFGLPNGSKIQRFIASASQHWTGQQPSIHHFLTSMVLRKKVMIKNG